jgi:hypothetical protein
MNRELAARPALVVENSDQNGGLSDTDSDDRIFYFYTARNLLE